MPISTSGEVPAEEPKKNVDYQRGISQENLEDLRSEFVSIGGIADDLPDIGSVRDNTQIYIPKTDANGKEMYDRYQAVNGKWFMLPDIAEHLLHADGSSEQYETGTLIDIDTVDVAVELLSGWTNHHLENMSNGDGVFTMDIAGDYQIHWSLSIISVGNNKDFAGGIMIDGEPVPLGWAHLTFAGGTDTGNMSSLSVTRLKEGQKVSVGVLNHTDDTNANIEHASFSVIRIR